jgi:hypothetical protein
LTAAELFTGNSNNFRRIFNWTSLIGQTTVIAMREPLALLSLTRNPEFFFKISKISKKKSKFQKNSNLHKISKFSQDFKIFKKFQKFQFA